MVAFAMSCVGILLFLWLSFGGPVPLRSEAYRFEVAVPEATTLAVESDVRISGVNVGKVKSKSWRASPNRTLLEVEVHPRYAPLPHDARAILRQKTCWARGTWRSHPATAGREAGRRRPLPPGQVEPTVELDEIFNVFTPRTRKAFQQSGAEFAKCVLGPPRPGAQRRPRRPGGHRHRRRAAAVVLNGQRTDLRRFVRNGSVVLGALNDRQGALRGVIVNSDDTLGALASRDEALSDTITILPTFLRESRATLRRVERFRDDSARS